ncbi:MAG TPA: hypothetical protein VHB27_02280 [Rhodopila sp.]|uniref:hypothetical protein n=1 Tax=Rhodopila sp. TaxID=2480087 RepID=UPI002C7ECC7A|nr:hypothetical protein [Rhodopila sp.]HVY14027.1 hypothetical protein [Rhodopila sp.]
MGQIIRLPISPVPYPNTSAKLDTAESVLLIAIRWWVAAYRQGENALARLCRGFEAAGAYEAAFAIDNLMDIVARTVRRPIDVHCPRCPNVSDDEKHLLHAAALAQAGQGDLAAKALRITLLSAQGADFALLALEGLGELFADARLFFRPRVPPTADGLETWSVAPPGETRH